MVLWLTLLLPVSLCVDDVDVVAKVGVGYGGIVTGVVVVVRCGGVPVCVVVIVRDVVSVAGWDC